MRPSDPSVADAPTVIRSEGAVAPTCHAAGRVIGPYELTESLGSGGMATVWKAVDRDAGRTVALKILPPDTAQDPAVVARFKNEARAAAALDHPAIAKAFQCGEWDGIHAIAFEYVPGETLKQKLDRDGPLAPRDAVAYLLDLAAGLGHAASRGVTHRDVKPSNVMVTPENRAVLIDMGLARRDAGATAGAVTTSGMTLGTFDYVSPEQALDPRTADVRSDLYSLGCTFYHVLTGHPPVPEGTAARKLQAHRNERPLDPRRLNPAVPDDLALVLSRLMVKRPRDRYQTPADLERDLLVVRDQLAAPPGGGPRLVPVAAPVVPASWLAAGLAVAAALYVVAAPTFAPRPPSPIAGARAVPAPADAPLADPTAPPTSPDGFRLAATADDLAALLRDNAPCVRLEPGREYDLTSAEDVVFTGPSLVLETAAGAAPATLILPATAAGADGTPTVRGAESVVLRRLVVRTVPPADDRPVIEPSGIAFERCGAVSLLECRFETHDGLRAGKVAAVALTADARAELTVRSCQFPTGSVALRLAGPVHATVAESVFGPHEAVFDLDAGRGTIALSHTSFLFRPDGGAAFDAAPGAAYAIAAGHCAFAAAGPPPVPAMMMGGRAVPVLLRSDAPATGTTFVAVADEPNAYYRIDAAAFGETVVPFEKRAEAKVDDGAAVVLAAPPWAEADPLAAVGSASAGSDPWRAFRLRLDVSALRVPRDIVVGARHRTADGTARVYPGDWPPPRPADLAAEPVKLWWPGAPEGEALPRNASRRLDDLVAAARPGDVIEIRHGGRLPVKPVRLPAADAALTIRAAPGSRPVLVPEGAFVEIADGSVTFEGVDVRLTGRGEPRAVAKITGAGSVTLRRCVVTSDDGDDRVAVVSVAGGEVDMRAPAGPAPRVRFDECLIRGTGRGMAAGRPFALDVVGSVVALDGPFLVADGTPREPASARGKVALTKSTFALAGPLVEWKAGRSGALPLDVEANRAFFAAVGPGKPLAVVDGGDALDSPDRVLTWVAEGCRYAHWDRSATFFEARPAPGGPPLRLDADEWFRQVTRESGRALSRGRSPRFPDSPRALAEALPADFPPPRRPDAFGPADPVGADPASLPKPVE